jgi:imidazolonepropionase-like amidohydrolase
MKKLFLLIALYLVTANLPAQRPLPGAAQTKSIRIYNVKIHVGNGEFIQNGEIGFANGKFNYVNDNSKFLPTGNKYDIQIDGGGKHIYPGFILTNSTIGLREVDAVRSTLDYDETGDITPEVRSITSYNTDSKIIPTIRFNGVLIAQSTPRGGLISGQSSIVQLDAWNWEDAAITMKDGMHINWPNRNRRIYRDQKTDENTLKKERNIAIGKIKDLVERTMLYMNETSHADYNSKCESLIGLFTGTKRLYLHVNTEKDIIESVNYFESIGVKKIVLVGAYEAWKITDFIKQHQLPIILDRIHELPHNDDDDIKHPYKVAKILWDAGIVFTFSHDGDMEVMGSRNLPFNAGTTVTYGLKQEEAVQLITLNAAKILGIDNRLGSIEVGKDATFFVSDGDALDIMTNQLALAYINGRQLELKNSQYQLYEMYMGKYGLEIK